MHGLRTYPEEWEQPQNLLRLNVWTTPRLRIVKVGSRDWGGGRGVMGGIITFCRHTYIQVHCMYVRTLTFCPLLNPHKWNAHRIAEKCSREKTFTNFVLCEPPAKDFSTKGSLSTDPWKFPSSKDSRYMVYTSSVSIKHNNDFGVVFTTMHMCRTHIPTKTSMVV